MAINNLGIYQLSDIQDRVRRLLDAVTFNVNQTSGAESNLVIQDQTISNTEITNQVNESLMGLYVEMLEGRDSLFTTETVIAIPQSTSGTGSGFNPGPFAFPANMFDLKWMKWKTPGVPVGQCTEQHWHPMAMVTDPNDQQMSREYRAPTWYWIGGNFKLNHNGYLWGSGQGTSNAIKINYVTLPPELVDLTDTVTVPPRLVRVTQQAVIYDAVVMLAAAKKRNVQPEIKERQQMWHNRALISAINAYRSDSVQMVTDRMVQNSFSGKRYRRTGWNGGGNG